MREATQVNVALLAEDDELRVIHLGDAITSMFKGEPRVSLLMLRDVINAGIGFKALGIKVGKSDKNLMKMLNGQQVPSFENALKIIEAVLDYEKLRTEMTLEAV